MKRRLSKHQTLQAEKRLAAEVKICLSFWSVADEDWREGMLYHLGLLLTDLLGFLARLDDSWPRDRWLDGLREVVSVSIESPQVIRIRGVLWWGLLSNVGGALTAEPFDGTIRLTGSRRRPLAYALSFGQGDERRYFSKGV
jgi:hypothetical protein